MASRFGPGDWWQSLYDDIVAELFMVRRDARENSRTAWFLIHTLGLDPGSTAFDQCCGIGTLSLPLAENGVRVVGVDQSAEYVRRASEAAAARGLPCQFHAADAFTFTSPTPCDAALNWNTGFGNAADDDRNRQMLCRAFESLKPGSRFLLDYQHVARVLRQFQHTLSYRLATPAGEVLLLREGEADLAAGALRQRWTFVLPDGTRRERHSLVRLYLPHELARLLAEAGFEEVEFLGGIDGEPLELDSPRCIALARRPA
ncbi:MAG TPA: class I SAM-dependent methyltransferase [Gemmataceae bacterium]|nr:class I SAM-dependent methyltransferase [Gemmataceae bacterium]